MKTKADIVIVGAGAAGLMAGIWAGRTYPSQTIVILDSARKVGAKILISGGGRCNVTHDIVRADAYAGSSHNAIKKVLQRFDVAETTDFFRELGVRLKREETGKLFPTTDSARTILDALLRAVNEVNISIQNAHRVETVERNKEGFRVAGNWGQIATKRVILASGGKSLPKSGSDGHGYVIARSLGHQLTKHILPALVPLTLPCKHFVCGLSGITIPATLTLQTRAGKRLIAFTDSTLCTHFGLSGPSVLDFSRYYLDAKLEGSDVITTINWIPDKTHESFEAELLELGNHTLFRFVNRFVPERLAMALLTEAGIEPNTRGHQMTRDQRKHLTNVATRLPLPITGSRGFTYAEVTAGGVPLSEVRLETMESRPCPGLYLCGEICDVDGRIGGYNFQWAWASGYVAGVAAGIGK